MVKILGRVAHVIGRMPRSRQSALPYASLVSGTHIVSRLLHILSIEAGLEPNGRHRGEENLK